MAKDEFYVDAAYDDDYAYAEERTKTHPGVGAGAARLSYAGQAASPAELDLDTYAQNPTNEDAMRKRQRTAVGRRREARVGQSQAETPLQKPFDALTDHLTKIDEYTRKP